MNGPDIKHVLIGQLLEQNALAGLEVEKLKRQLQDSEKALAEARAAAGAASSNGDK